MINKKNKIIILIMLILANLSLGFSTISLNYIHFDPAIIAAGDDVDIVIQYETDNLPFENDKIGSDEYTFNVKLLPDDDLTKKYVLITDSLGDDVAGNVFRGDKFYKTFKVKVNTNAPTGSYEFKLEGQWYKNGIPQNYKESLRFTMPVKKEGIVLDVSSIVTTPSQVRSGDKFVEIKTTIENVGNKNAKSVEVILETNNEKIVPSYTNNNRFWIGSVPAQENRDVSFFVNLDDLLENGIHNLTYKLNYMDLDDNRYNKTRTIPFLIKSRPYLTISKIEGSGLAGGKSKLKIWVKNEGEVSAEAIDVRILKESTQPFEFDIRSAYLGELKPNEEGVVTFNIDVLKEADLKKHNLKLVIRAKGDTDEGDDNIYTFKRRATFDVTGIKQNNYINYGLWILGIVALLFIFNKINNKKKNQNKK